MYPVLLDMVVSEQPQHADQPSAGSCMLVQREQITDFGQMNKDHEHALEADR